jgi:hypothetical protein
MSTNEWIAVGVAVVILVVVALLIAARVSTTRRRAHLREQFGPEYDRTVDAAGSRREAEDELAARERAHERLRLRSLSDAARGRFLEEWQGVQQRFVDDPDGAAAQAEGLVRRVMDERGYPADDDPDVLAGVVSVDHPEVVQRYREGRDALRGAPEGNAARTESLRRAMVDFRAVLETLLDAEPQMLTATG